MGFTYRPASKLLTVDTGATTRSGSSTDGSAIAVPQGLAAGLKNRPGDFVLQVRSLSHRDNKKMPPLLTRAF